MQNIRLALHNRQRRKDGPQNARHELWQVTFYRERLERQSCRPWQGDQNVGRYGRKPTIENLIEFTLEREVVWPAQPRTATGQYAQPKVAAGGEKR